MGVLCNGCFCGPGERVAKREQVQYKEGDIGDAVWGTTWYFPGGWRWVSSFLAWEPSPAEILESELIWCLWESILQGMTGERASVDTQWVMGWKVGRSQITDYACSLSWRCLFSLMVCWEAWTEQTLPAWVLLGSRQYFLVFSKLSLVDNEFLKKE